MDKSKDIEAMRELIDTVSKYGSIVFVPDFFSAIYNFIDKNNTAFIAGKILKFLRHFENENIYDIIYALFSVTVMLIGGTILYIESDSKNTDS